jgi:hypothetical protein
MSTDYSQILQEFRDSYPTEEGRRVVHLPKKEILEMSPNRGTADRRFRTLQKRLQQDNALLIIYEEQMLDHVVKQQVELAPTTENSNGVFYLPIMRLRRNAMTKSNEEQSLTHPPVKATAPL